MRPTKIGEAAATYWGERNADVTTITRTYGGLKRRTPTVYEKPNTATSARDSNESGTKCYQEQLGESERNMHDICDIEEFEISMETIAAWMQIMMLRQFIMECEKLKPAKQAMGPETPFVRMGESAGNPQ